MVAKKGVPGASALQRFQGSRGITDPHVGRRVRLPPGAGQQRARPDPPKPKVWKRNGVRRTRSSAVRCLLAAPPTRRRSPKPCSSWHHLARASSPARHCTSTAAEPLSESPIEGKSPCPRIYDSSLGRRVDGRAGGAATVHSGRRARDDRHHRVPAGEPGAPPHRHPAGRRSVTCSRARCCSSSKASRPGSFGPAKPSGSRAATSSTTRTATPATTSRCVSSSRCCAFPASRCSTLVDDEELAARRDRRVPAEAKTK